MDNPVAQAVAAKLGLTPERGGDVVRHLVQHVRSQVSHGQPVLIPELGTFTLTGENLEFTPDPGLAGAVGGSVDAPESISFPHQGTGMPKWLKSAFVVLGVLLIAAAGYWGYTRLQPGSDQPESAADSPTESLIADDPGQIEPAETRDNSVTENTAADTPEIQSGVETLPLPVGGFTLVIASLPDDSTAQALASEYRSLVAPAVVEVVLVPEFGRFRVIVGRSPTREGIDELKEQLVDLPDDTWVLELE